jgi:hypothetical protein
VAFYRRIDPTLGRKCPVATLYGARLVDATSSSVQFACASGPIDDVFVRTSALRHVWTRRNSGKSVNSKMESRVMSDRENILSALREKPLKVFEIMRRANVTNEESCQSLLLKMRDEGSVKFDIHKGRWFIA